MKNFNIKTKLLLMVIVPFLTNIFFATSFILDEIRTNNNNLSITITMVIMILLMILFFMVYISRDIICKLDKLRDGLTSFYKYINHDSKRFKIISINGNDEFTKILYIINNIIKETTKHIQKELKYHILQEKQMIHQSRHAAMGEMMRAIIHQWKQPLNAISVANSSMNIQAELNTLDKELLIEQTNYINQQIKHMSNTISNFKDFFKPQKKIKYNISDSIQTIYKMIERVFTIDSINIKMQLDNNLFTNGYSNELNQVLINILNNARDAIKETNCDIHDIFIKSFKENNNAIITITDCAGGVPLSIIDKIFDPYVTTKSDDKGTGIGLDMSKTIINKVDGDLTVENVITTIDDIEYRGACFIIKLNLNDDEE